MQRFLTSVGAALALLLVATPAAAQQDMAQKAPQGKQYTVTGTVIDVSCKFGQGLSGEGHRMCSQVCADKGIPLAILTSDGTLYVPVSAGMPGESQNGRLKEFAEQTVTVKGKVFEAGGAQAIQIESISRKS